VSDDMSAYKDVFLSESAEYIQSITDGLLALESDPHDLGSTDRARASIWRMSAESSTIRTLIVVRIGGSDARHRLEALLHRLQDLGRLERLDEEVHRT